MDNKRVECSVDVVIDNQVRNIKIRHNQQVCDARIRVDEKTVEAKSQILQNGGALFFDYSNSKIIITIMNINEEYVYDCFVNGISVKDDMPWKLGKYELPDVLKWEKRIQKGMKKYIINEAIKGAVTGMAIFLLLFILKLIMPDLMQKINMFLYLLISIIPLTAIYALLSPNEYKQGAKSVELYKSFRDKKTIEESDQKHDNIIDCLNIDDYLDKIIIENVNPSDSGENLE